MSVLDLVQLKSQLPAGMRLIGLDLGEKTIGIALSDTLLMVATPFETLKRGKFTADAKRLQDIMTAQGAGGVIVGFPLNMDGSTGPAAQSARAFANNFTQATSLPVTLWDERMSTAAVTRTLLDADTSRAKRAQVVDKMAAAYILQGALERLRQIA
ncbi:MAG TPA: Holliday junction resolvase RuvX [Rhizomicrobium sp.]|nr:Holliday junction resolvase RuvX [Rhizomicrobium sp.]